MIAVQGVGRRGRGPVNPFDIGMGHGTGTFSAGASWVKVVAAETAALTFAEGHREVVGEGF